MKCKNCGTELFDDSICHFCGYDYNNDNVEKKKNNASILIIIVVCSLVTLFGFIFIILNDKSNKLICKSERGNITIIYDDEIITNYKSVVVNNSQFVMNYDYSVKLIRKYGLAEFLDALKKLFEEDSNGSCKYEGFIPKMKSEDNPLDLRNPK